MPTATPETERPRLAAASLDRLRRAGLKATRQRLALTRLLFTGADRHVTAEQLHAEAVAAGLKVSLATIYNTLHQFTAAGLLRKVVIHQGQLYFDTNVADHSHFFHTASGRLHDIEGVAVSNLPAVPPGSRILRVDVVVHLADADPD